jgi:two-component system cell cycle sensor histidine kinase/response regulator CckA
VTPIVLLNAFLVGVFAFAGIHHFYVWRLSRTSRLPAVIAIYSTLSALQMVAVVTLNSSTDLRLSQVALDARTTFGVCAGALMAWLVAELTGFRPRKFLMTVTALPLAGAVINTTIVSIAGQVTAINEVVMPWGETIRAVERQGTVVWLALLMYACAVAVFLFAVVAGLRWIRTDRTGGILTAIAGATGLANAVFALLIDMRVVQSPYIGLVGNGLWILIATILFSREHAARENRLKASEARLAAVIANSPGVAVQWFDEDGRVVLWNQASEQLFGIAAADAIGKTLDQLFYPPEHFPAFLETLATIHRTGDSVGQMEFTFQRGTETRICVSTLFEIPADIGSSRFVCMDVDITERKRAEEALAISEARYRTLIESAPEAIVVLDVEAGRLVDLNAEACRFFGASTETLLPMTPMSLSPPTQPDGRASATAAESYIRQAIDGEAPVFEWTHRTLAGQDVPTEVRLVRLPDPSRVLVRGSITDISDRHRLEEQLRQSQKMEAIGQLAGGVAHDFNNLLTIISGYTEILHAQLPPTDSKAALVKAIGDATERAGWLTARLLAFGRRAVLTPQVFDLNVLVRDSEQILRRLIGEHIALRVDASPVALHVKLDPGQWSQVMLNLAINARDAMPDGGMLSIRTFGMTDDTAFRLEHPDLAPGPYAAFSVTDTGTGMQPEVRARIFEPFFTTKELGRGTGLGLAVVHGIVTQAGGAIDVETAPGRGTTFTVSLPAAAAAPVLGPAGTARGELGAGETVLVVEDETVLRELLDVALTASGFKVLAAADGEEALRLFESMQSRPDLLVTDMVMPGRFNGRELADVLRGLHPGLKVLFISGYIDDPALRTTGFGRDDQCLQKPFSLAAIAQKARETLDRA